MCMLFDCFFPISRDKVMLTLVCIIPLSLSDHFAHFYDITILHMIDHWFVLDIQVKIGTSFAGKFPLLFLQLQLLNLKKSLVDLDLS